MRIERLVGRPALAGIALGLLSVLASGPPPPPAGAQGTLSALETDVDQILRATRPSVVTLVAQRTVSQSRRRGVQERQRLATRIGSGVAVGEHTILTTASVVDGAERIFVRTSNGLQAAATVVGSDPISNLALLQVRGVRLPALSFSTAAAPREGEWVMAIGTSPYRAQITQSVGSVAHRHREPRLALLQLTNLVYPGYSGGAAVDARGRLVGIVQGELDSGRGDGYDTYRGSRNAFVLPVEAIRPVLESLEAHGRVRHGYLGVSTRAAAVESASEEGATVPIGALVESVQPGGPAARAGLVKGDLIVGFERERVEYPEQLARWVAASRPGSTVELVWVRDELQHRARAVLGVSPDPVPQWARAGGAAEPPARIADLQREIRRLNRELERLKDGASQEP